MSSEEKLKYNIRFLLKAQLALESYEDENEIQLPIIQEVYNEHNDFRNIRLSLNNEEQIKISDKIIKKYNDSFDIVGRDNFIFYNDGNINYIWKGLVKKN